MELSAVGESVFAAESIIKRRIRRVFAAFFSTHTPCPRAEITQPFSLVRRRRHAIRRYADYFTGVFFAGSLGISREMEGLVSEVSIFFIKKKKKRRDCEGQRSILAARTNCTSAVWRYSGCVLFPKYLPCVWLSVRLMSPSGAPSMRKCPKNNFIPTGISLKSAIAFLAMAGFTMRHCPLRSLQLRSTQRYLCLVEKDKKCSTPRALTRQILLTCLSTNRSPARSLAKGTAPGSRRKTFWMPVSSPPSRRGEAPTAQRRRRAGAALRTPRFEKRPQILKNIENTQRDSTSLLLYLGGGGSRNRCKRSEGGKKVCGFEDVMSFFISQIGF